jgi:hypothetical protein
MIYRVVADKKRKKPGMAIGFYDVLRVSGVLAKYNNGAASANKSDEIL